MVDAKEFLTQFTKDLIANPAHRLEIIAGWAKHMEAREILLSQEVHEVQIGYTPKKIVNGVVVEAELHEVSMVKRHKQ